MTGSIASAVQPYIVSFHVYQQVVHFLYFVFRLFEIMPDEDNDNQTIRECNAFAESKYIRDGTIAVLKSWWLLRHT